MKTRDELNKMRDAGRVTAEILAIVREQVRPGVSTGELDELAEREAKKRNSVPSFKGYHGFPASTCISVNAQIVHGIPSRKRVLKPGDVVKVDFGAVYGGWHGDSAFTVALGEADDDVRRLLEATQAALRVGIEASKAGGRLGDVSAAIQAVAQANRLSIIPELTGHAIGRAMHEGFSLPNFGRAGSGMRLRPGMTYTVEPMFALGGPETDTLPDGWTVVMRDGAAASHFEHTVAVTEHGPEILTLP